MPLDWSDRSSTVDGITYYEQLFYPSSGTIPSARSLSDATRFAWNDREAISLLGEYYALQTIRFLWGDDPGNPIDTVNIGHIARCTSITVDNANTATASASFTADSFKFIDVGGIGDHSLGFGTSGGPFVFDASSASLLSAYYFPNPTHFFMGSDEFSDYGLVPVTMQAPTHPRAYMQPYHRYFRQGNAPFGSSAGIGGRDSGESRLISVYGASTQYGAFSGQGEPFKPLLNALELNGTGIQLPNPSGATSIGAGAICSAAYGQAAEVEIGIIMGSGDGGDHSITLPSHARLDVYLYEYGLEVPNVFVNEIATTLIHTFNVPVTSSYTAPGPFGATAKYYTMSPTAVSIPDLSDDTTHWLIVAFSSYEDGGPVTFAPIAQIFVWHKVPCTVKPYAIDGSLIGEDIYIPGWLYAPPV